MPLLEVRNIHKTYENRSLLTGVSLSVDAGETVCLLGPSGSGKSTLLRIISGLEQAEQGEVSWQGKNLAGVPVHQRNFGLMFQDYALFPHRNVAQNVAFGLRMQNLPQAEIDPRVEAALAQVNLTGFAQRRVTELSGGEQQRVALARALAPAPRLLMLDEPLGALDRALRTQLTEEVRRVLHISGIPAIYVTHDQEEAFAIADRMILLHDGHIVQQGIPADVFDHPNSAWVARFLGLDNLLDGTVRSTRPLTIHTAAGDFLPQDAPADLSVGQAVCLLLRPGGAEAVTEQSGVNMLTGMVMDVVFAGDRFKIELNCQGTRLIFYLAQPLDLNKKVTLHIADRAVQCLEAACTKSISLNVM